MRKASLFAVSALALAWSTGAYAQVSDTDATEGPEEAPIADTRRDGDIIVTATKLATNVQDVPISITAVTSETLQARSITTSSDLGAIVPNAMFRPTVGNFGRGLSAFMRGIGQGDTGFAAEPGVAFYIDDGYYPLVHGSIFDLLDLDHVEVLRGPQGTLFGRNSIAGAINLVSKEPSQVTSAYVNLTLGSFNRVDLRAGFNVPLTDDLALRVSGFSKNQQGYQERLDFRCEMIRRRTPELAGNFPFSDGTNYGGPSGTGEDACVVGHLGGTKAHGIRGALKWEPLDNFEFTVIGDYSNETSSAQADSLISINPAAASTRPAVTAVAALYSIPGQQPFAFDERFLTGNPFTTYATFADPIAAGQVVPGSIFYNGSVTRGGVGFEPVNPVRNWGVTAKAVYGLTDSIDFTAIAGYRDLRVGYTADVDQTPMNLELTRNQTTHKQTTLEARLTGRMDWMDWVLGAFYYKAEEFEYRLIVSPFSNLQRYRNDTYEPQNKSAYANATLRPIGDAFSIQLGLRYSDDQKPLNFNNVQDGNPAGNIIFQQTLETSRFDWKVGASYEPAPNMLIYASAATGFRLPTFNSRPFQPSQVFQIPGDDLIAYELGSKLDLFDRRLRLNGAVFYTDYKQRSSTVNGSEYQLGPNGQPLAGGQVTDPLPGGPAGSTVCRNRTPAEIAAGVAGFLCVPRSYPMNNPGEVYGFELELSAEPVDNLTIDGSVGYAKFDSPDLRTPGRITDRLLGIPEWTGSAGIQYQADVPVLAGTITPRLDWLYTGSIDWSATRAVLNRGAYSIFNARLTYDNEPNDFSVAFAVTNLLDKVYALNYFDLSGFGFPQTNSQPARPQEWSVSLTKRF